MVLQKPPHLRTNTLISFVLIGAALHAACTSDEGANVTRDDDLDSGGHLEPAASGGASNTDEADDDFDLTATVDTSSGGSADVVGEVTIIDSLPSGFSPADEKRPELSRGGFQVLGPLAEVGPPQGECGNILRIIARDFSETHDDFLHASDWNPYEVLSPIGASRKPEKVGENGPLHFDEWYQNSEGINLPFAVDLWLEPVGETFVFDSTAFFPLAQVGNRDAYFFTTELHTNFQYSGGEVFTFRGDDDVFVFINGHEAVNLSGVHTAQEASVSLDERATEFGLETGGVYTFDLFQAERQPDESNFRLETTLDFTGCGEILSSDVIIR